MTEVKNTFAELRKIDVSDKIEKKGNLSYLSWAWAVDTLLQLDPDAKWIYEPSQTFPDGSMMIYCTVTVFGKQKTAQLPVMDHKNKAIKNPDAFEINKAMQRCLVKAIALHGLGLHIYAGEDVPSDGPTPDDKKREDGQKREEKPARAPASFWNTPDEQKGWAAASIEQIAIWTKAAGERRMDWLKKACAHIHTLKTPEEVERWKTANVRFIEKLGPKQQEHLNNHATKRIQETSQAPLQSSGEEPDYSAGSFAPQDEEIPGDFSRQE